MNSIAPIWDGNETWLVLGGLGLLAAFPTAFAVIVPAVYFPILVMLLALVFRGVAFEFRLRDAENKTFWDHAFCYGSAIATFAQGVVLGAFVQGFPVQDGQFAGTSLSFLTPFSVLTGVALMFGYGLLGAGWLIMKTEGAIQAAARRQGRICLIGVVAAIAIVSVWTPIMVPAVRNSRRSRLISSIRSTKTRRAACCISSTTVKCRIPMCSWSATPIRQRSKPIAAQNTLRHSAGRWLNSWTASPPSSGSSRSGRKTNYEATSVDGRSARRRRHALSRSAQRSIAVNSWHRLAGPKPRARRNGGFQPGPFPFPNALL